MSIVNNTNATVPVWTKYTVGFAALQVAALTNTVNVATLPAKSVLMAAKFDVTTAFSGGAIATLTASLGRSGNVAKYLVATSVAGTGLVDGVALTVPVCESTVAGTTITLTAVSTVANLSALTQGSMNVYIQTSALE